MFQLFSRFAWIVSLVSGYMIILFFGSVMEGFRYINGEEAFVLGIFGVLMGLLIKKIIFSQAFIEERVRFFAQAIGGGKETKKVKKNPLPIEVPIEKIVEKPAAIKSTPLVDTKKSVKIEKNLPHIDSQLVLAIKGFFRENILAKIGGILLFLGVLFFLNLLYTVVGPVAKVLMGLAFGFTVYSVGIYLDKKGFINESRVLLGLGILINYLVILSGRYLIGENFSDGSIVSSGVLSTGITFLFLILNTIFGIVTSLVYLSRVLLLFSFVFAYINPLLVGGSSDTPYILIGYSAIVAFASIFLAGNKRFSIDGPLLSYITFFGANILFLIAPFQSDIGWITKIISFFVLTLILVYSSHKREKSTEVLCMLGCSYVFFLGYLFLGLGNLAEQMLVDYMYGILMLPVIGLFIFTNYITFQTTQLSKGYNILFFLPLIVLLIIMMIFPINLSISTLIVSMIMYIVVLCLPDNHCMSGSKYSLSIVFALFLVVSQFLAPLGILSDINSFGSIEKNTNLFQYIILLGVSGVFLLVTYIFSLRKHLSGLYLIGTLGFICSTIQIITIVGSAGYMIASLMVLFTFWGLNILIPFFSHSYLENIRTFRSYLIGFVLGIIYIGFHIYRYMSEYYPGIALGFAFLAAGAVYFFVAYLRLISLDVDFKKDTLSLEKNMVLTYTFGALSIFTLSVAFIFSGQKDVISIIWLLEATLLLYFFNSLKNYKIFIAAMILMCIGISQVANYLQDQWGTFMVLVPMTLITISLFVNTILLSKYTNKSVRIPHDILHVIMIFMTMGCIHEVLPNVFIGFSHFSTALYVVVLAGMYAHTSSSIQKGVLIFILGLLFVIHAENVEQVLRKSISEGVFWYSLVQYLVTLILSATGWIFAKKSLKGFQKGLLIYMTIVYSFVVSTLYVFYIFDTTFAITIYWGALAFLLLSYGILTDIIKLRTIGLYILFLTLGKILLHDIWIGFDDAILRVGALMVVGAMMIIISMMYSKKYGNNLVGEFKIENLK